MRLGWRRGMTLMSGMALLGGLPRSAAACGGWFNPQTSGLPSSTVTVQGHRVAVAVSPGRTVLWDQIHYQGNPGEFSWVLPVRGAVEVGVGNDAWFDALDTATNVVISPPPLHCYSRNQSSSGGCSCVTEVDDTANPGGRSVGSNTLAVVRQDSVGPYSFVQVRASEGGSLVQWLLSNGYAVPDDARPTIDAYVAEGFDFVAAKLRSLSGVPRTVPIRIVTEGAPVLPLRMASTGASSSTDWVLYLIGEKRYALNGAIEAKVDLANLVWNWAGTFDDSPGLGPGRSNYVSERDKVLSQGPAWLTSFAAPKAFGRVYANALGEQLSFTSSTSSSPSGTGPVFTNLTDLYFGQAAATGLRADICQNVSFRVATRSQVVDTCKDAAAPASDAAAPASDAAAPASDAAAPASDAAAPASDAAAPASDAAAPASDAGLGLQKGDAGPACPNAPTGTIAKRDLECNGFDDVGVALLNLHPSDVWVSRLEARLAKSSLTRDLEIVPAAVQDEVSSAHRAATHANPPCDLLEEHTEAERGAPHAPVERAGLGFASVAGLWWARRRYRRPRSS